MVNCTIIIPTYNRPSYLKRILNYYSHYGRDFCFIVADSSSGENKLKNKRIINSVSGIQIDYLDHYSCKITLLGKLNNSLTYADTEYCVFCADDDFITPAGIHQSVEFLVKNKDFSCAHGFYISYDLIEFPREKPQLKWCPIYPFNSIIFNDSCSRLRYLFSSYYQTFYAVHRTNFQKMVFRENVNYANDDRFGELLPSMLDLVYGKMKKINVLYDMREKISNSAGARIKNIGHFIKEGTFEKKYYNFKICLIKHLRKNVSISQKEANILINKGMSVYLKSNYLIESKSTLIRELRNFLDKMYLPEYVKENINRLYRSVFLPKHILQNLKDMNLFKNNLENQDSKYFIDFKKIHDHILLHAKKSSGEKKYAIKF